MSGAVARRYTRGLFSYASEHGLVRDVDGGLAVVADALRGEPKFRALLEHPLISVEEKAAMLDRVFGQAVHPIVLRFLKLLIQRGRADQTLAVADAFHTLAEEAEGLISVAVESAFPLPEAQARELEERLGQALNKRVRAVVSVNPDLLAGVRIQVGHRVIDASLVNAIQQFARNLAQRGARRGA
ncbi:ATP synthase F1 subunit delta [Alicyclobacillus sp.]|uniref:ATP synthase F1 subunit delta n=1 Tax=Alicyclobacillus sp. TaxID=61169 RepID=UPI0025BBB1F0|nr:ATP synthase F1 subunit delta [Alicyclobacillus sp.]MCL6517170.1 ATP synthase F1 subunit delta [Alicyclobacillus sp.]